LISPVPRALNTLRPALENKRDAFNEGLPAAGFELVQDLRRPEPGDVLVVWNRQGGFHEQAREFERRGATVLVAENGYLGKRWRGEPWVALSIGHHAGAGEWRPGGSERWDSWGVELPPYRAGGEETLVFAQRGIGEPGIASPPGWAENARRRIRGGRIRQHPGKGEGVPLAIDLARARDCVTWNSGAALLALLEGVPVWCDFPQWFGAGACWPLSEYGRREPRRDDAARHATFRRLAWAMWTIDEIRSGEPIRRLAGV
jgi:hypothetical protein